MTTSTLPHLLDVTKALSSHLRLRMLAVVAEQELCVGQIAAIFDVARSTASEQLSELRRAGLVVERRAGRYVWYQLVDESPSLSIARPVLDQLAGDEQVESDREMALRILALPQDLVCELGRGALALEDAAVAGLPPPRPSPASGRDQSSRPPPL